MTLPLLRLGTRGSQLALAQARLVAEALAGAWPGLSAPGAIETVVIRTTGDRIQDRPLSAIGGKGLFTKELEEALAERRIDVAVHSTKDLPGVLPPGFALGCVLERGDPRDALVMRAGSPRRLADLPPGCSIGTSALRRQSQILALRPDIAIRMMRGNIDTRLRKLDDGEVDAIILAAAGLRRIGLGARITLALDPAEFVPAVGQGAVCCEVRDGDARVLDLLARVGHGETTDAVRAERAMLLRLEGNCRTPIAGHATIEAGRLSLTGFVATPDGREGWRADGTAAPVDAEALGDDVARRILEMAGDRFPRLD
jgi:hydroxymethylbilane synthase